MNGNPEIRLSMKQKQLIIINWAEWRAVGTVPSGGRADGPRATGRAATTEHKGRHKERENLKLTRIMVEF